MNNKPLKITDFEIEPSRVKVVLPEGPFQNKSMEDHSWVLEARTDGGDGSVSLYCTDPCDMPYDMHTGRQCSCVWVPESVSEGTLDVVIEDVKVTIKHEDFVPYQQMSYGDDYDPGWISAKVKT